MTDRDERFWRELTATRRQAAAAEERELAEAERALAETGDGEELGEDRIEAMARAAEALAAQEERVADAAAVPPRRWTPARLLVAALVVLFAGNLVIAGVQLTSAAFRDVSLRRTPETVRYQEALRILVEPLHDIANRQASQVLISSNLRWGIGVLRGVASEESRVGLAASGHLIQLRQALSEAGGMAAPDVSGDPTELAKLAMDATSPVEERLHNLERLAGVLLEGLIAMKTVEVELVSDDLAPFQRQNAALLGLLKKELL